MNTTELYTIKSAKLSGIQKRQLMSFLLGGAGVFTGAYGSHALGLDRGPAQAAALGLGALGFISPLVGVPKVLKRDVGKQKEQLERKQRGGERLSDQDQRNLDYLTNYQD